MGVVILTSLQLVRECTIVAEPSVFLTRRLRGHGNTRLNTEPLTQKKQHKQVLFMQV